jgi:hypothetical protein
VITRRGWRVLLTDIETDEMLRLQIAGAFRLSVMDR